MFEQFKEKSVYDEMHKLTRGFKINFCIHNIKKDNLEEVAKILAFKKEINYYHQISYWKLGEKEQISGYIIFRKKWKKRYFPNMNFIYQNKTILSHVQTIPFQEYKKIEESIRLDADYILETNAPIVESKFIEQLMFKKSESKYSANEDREDQSMFIQQPLKIKQSNQSEPFEIQLSELQFQEQNYKVIKKIKEENKLKKIVREKGYVVSLTDDNNFKFFLTAKALKGIWSIFDKKSCKFQQLAQNYQKPYKFKQKINQCYLGQPLSLDFMEKFIQYLQTKYINNKNTYLIGQIQGISQLEVKYYQEKVYTLKQQNKIGLYAFIYIEENHASLIIYYLEKQILYHCDALLMNKQHISKLKSNLQQFIMKLFHNEKLIQNYFWEQIQIIRCPNQVYDNDSLFCCLRNIHEFLLQDKIILDLTDAYFINEMLHYRQFLAACIIYDKYLSPY